MKYLYKFLLVCFFLNVSFAQKDSTNQKDVPSALLNNSFDEITYRPVSSVSDLSLNINVPGSLTMLRGGNPYSEYDPFKTEIDYPVLYGLGALYLGAGIGVHIYQSNAWWKDNRTSFHFQNDWPYALWIDKIGHFYAANLLVHAFSAGLEAANYPTEDAMIYGTIAALAFQYYVEVEDGFGANWGFSPGDAISNTLGAGYALAQYYFPYLQNFQFKISYYPSKKMRDGVHPGNIFDDYEGQKYWLTFRMKNLLPDDLEKVWPAFLNLAVGMGTKDLDGLGGGRREFYIGFDFNVLELPLFGRFGNFIKNTLNYLHLPMPGIRISPDSAFFVFLF